MPRSLLLAMSAFATLAVAMASEVPADANRDGQVSQIEFVTNRRALVLQADLNGDDRIGSLEWARQAGRLDSMVATRGYPSTGQAGEAPAFSQVDLNSDGTLDRTELDVALRDRFAKLDANRDGVLTGPEARDLIAAAPR